MAQCVFCEKIASENLPEVKEGSEVFYFEPLNPVTKGHTLFVPREHFSVAGVSPAETGWVVNHAVQYADNHFFDYNVIINNGRFASQTIRHLHVHIVPRHENDGLMLPWTNQKV